MTVGPGISFEDTKFISEEAHTVLCKRANPRQGDILITKDGTLGVTRVVETCVPFSIFVSVALLRPIVEQIDSYFLRFALESESSWQQFESLKSGSGLKHLVLRDLGNLVVPLPPLREQMSIVGFIKSGLTSLENALNRVQTQITRLQEYRQALITAAVTGQLEIPLLERRS